MSVVEKYAKLIEYAKVSGVQNLSANEQGGVLYVSGVADTVTKNELWKIYTSIDPEMRAGDLVLNVEDSGAPAGGIIHEVKGGENLSVIATKYPGMTWQKIFEANKDILQNPDKIFPGQKLRIPS